MTKTLYSFVSPITGQPHSRNSTKTHFTHAAVGVAQREDGTIVERVSFCGSLELAWKAADTHYKNLATFPQLTMVGSDVVELAEASQ